jgi:hypothetical protein
MREEQPAFLHFQVVFDPVRMGGGASASATFFGAAKALTDRIA